MSNITIELPVDSAKCLYRAMNYYVEAFEMKGLEMVQSSAELRDLVERDLDQFGAGDRVIEYEEDLARELLKVLK